MSASVPVNRAAVYPSMTYGSQGTSSFLSDRKSLNGCERFAAADSISFPFRTSRDRNCATYRDGIFRQRSVLPTCRGRSDTATLRSMGLSAGGNMYDSLYSYHTWHSYHGFLGENPYSIRRRSAYSGGTFSENRFHCRADLTRSHSSPRETLSRETLSRRTPQFSHQRREVCNSELPISRANSDLDSSGRSPSTSSIDDSLCNVTPETGSAGSGVMPTQKVTDRRPESFTQPTRSTLRNLGSQQLSRRSLAASSIERRRLSNNINASRNTVDSLRSQEKSKTQQLLKKIMTCKSTQHTSNKSSFKSRRLHNPELQDEFNRLCYDQEVLDRHTDDLIGLRDRMGGGERYSKNAQDDNNRADGSSNGSIISRGYHEFLDAEGYYIPGENNRTKPSKGIKKLSLHFRKSPVMASHRVGWGGCKIKGDAVLPLAKSTKKPRLYVLQRCGKTMLCDRSRSMSDNRPAQVLDVQGMAAGIYDDNPVSKLMKQRNGPPRCRISDLRTTDHRITNYQAGLEEGMKLAMSLLQGADSFEDMLIAMKEISLLWSEKIVEASREALGKGKAPYSTRIMSNLQNCVGYVRMMCSGMMMGMIIHSSKMMDNTSPSGERLLFHSIFKLAVNMDTMSTLIGMISRVEKNRPDHIIAGISAVESWGAWMHNHYTSDSELLQYNEMVLKTPSDKSQLKWRDYTCWNFKSPSESNLRGDAQLANIDEDRMMFALPAEVSPVSYSDSEEIYHKLKVRLAEENPQSGYGRARITKEWLATNMPANSSVPSSALVHTKSSMTQVKKVLLPVVGEYRSGVAEISFADKKKHANHMMAVMVGTLHKEIGNSSKQNALSLIENGYKRVNGYQKKHPEKSLGVSSVLDSMTRNSYRKGMKTKAIIMANDIPTSEIAEAVEYAARMTFLHTYGTHYVNSSECYRSPENYFMADLVWQRKYKADASSYTCTHAADSDLKMYQKIKKRIPKDATENKIIQFFSTHNSLSMPVCGQIQAIESKDDVENMFRRFTGHVNFNDNKFRYNGRDVMIEQEHEVLLNDTKEPAVVMQEFYLLSWINTRNSRQG